MKTIETLIKDLPEPENARRFFDELSVNSPAEAKKLFSDHGLLSDVLTLVSFSPLLSTTLSQNPSYISWLKRQKLSQKERGKDEILESLARFALTNSTLDTNILLARFRRRELLSIYLRDIRNLGTIAEITEEISNLADAILEYALRIAIQELDNRYGAPFETAENDRVKASTLCVVALGKLGSKELNYASDIDLLFLYSAEGATAGMGTDGITNREYFLKLAQMIMKLVGGQSGEGAAYRVDLRLRPNGGAGLLAISMDDAIKYYKTTARAWERQVLIRSRASAGNLEIFAKFFESVKSNVFLKEEKVEVALRNVRESKEKIDLEKISEKGFDVKVGKGGIREIEFIAQALQLAYGGSDEWIRAPHTLISLSRLADRKLLSEAELTQLFDAYVFLRRLEHRLQMEHGLQTHLVPNDLEKQIPIAKRMNFDFLADFRKALEEHTSSVKAVFLRVFGAAAEDKANQNPRPKQPENSYLDPASFEGNTEKRKGSKALRRIISSLDKSDLQIDLTDEMSSTISHFGKITPHFAEFIAANPALVTRLGKRSIDVLKFDYQAEMIDRVMAEKDFPQRISKLRKSWSAYLIEIVENDVFESISMFDAKVLQTRLAEASIETAIEITKAEMEVRFKIEIDQFPFAVLGLGKLGGGGMDYGSDLDLVLIHDDEIELPAKNVAFSEFYARAVETFVTTLSSLTRDGLLYRVDLRLRPDGNKGATSSSKSSFLNYLETRSAIWEWLAYVKVRAVAGDMKLAHEIETHAKSIIHKNAVNSAANDLRSETIRVRERLEREKSRSAKTKEIDIKYGEGGLLDIYFAMRFLQLRDNLPDDPNDRSTANMLTQLHLRHSLSEENFQNFAEGYDFFSKLDHQLRLIIGRSTIVPKANKTALNLIARRMNLSSVQTLLENLSANRLNVRDTFLDLLKIHV